MMMAMEQRSTVASPPMATASGSIIKASTESPEYIGVSASFDDINDRAGHPGATHSLSMSFSKDSSYDEDRNVPGIPRPYPRGAGRSSQSSVMSVYNQQGGSADPAPKRSDSISLAPLDDPYSADYERYSMDFEENEEARVQQERILNRTKLPRKDPSAFVPKKMYSSTSSGASPGAEGAGAPGGGTFITGPEAAKAIKKSIAARNFAPRNNSLAAGAPRSDTSPSRPVQAVYSYEDLKARSSKEELASRPYPSDVDVNFREQYLRDDEFVRVFGMSKADFNSIAKWRRQELKKRHNLT
jgi:hypothetical protein